MPFNPFSSLTSKLFGGLAALLALGLATQTIRIEGLWFIVGFKQQVATLRIDLTKVRDLRAAERANHRQTKQNYRDAQFQAALMEEARLARVQARQREITHDVSQEYQRRLAAARARYDSLRRARGPAGSLAGGAPGCEPVSGLPAAPGGTDAPPADCGFPRADQLERDLIATEQAAQLGSLIEFVEKQAAVDPNR